MFKPLFSSEATKLDIMVGVDGVLRKASGKILFVGNGVGKIFDDLAVGIACLVFIGVYVIDNVAVFFVGVKDSFLVPFINGSISLGGVGLVFDPVGVLPAQDGYLDGRVDFLASVAMTKPGEREASASLSS